MPFANCPVPFSLADLERELGAAEVALERFESVALEAPAADSPLVTATTRLHEVLACVAVTVPAPLAARIHLFEGESAFLPGGTFSIGKASLAAAHVADPGLSLPARYPVGSEPQAVWAQVLAETPAPRVVVPGAERAWMVVDGTATTTRSEGHPALMQQVCRDGTPVSTALLGPGALQVDVERNACVPRSLLVGAGVAALASGGLYAAGWVTWSANETDIPQLQVEGDRLKDINHVLLVSSGALAATAVGLTTAAFTVRW